MMCPACWMITTLIFSGLTHAEDVDVDLSVDRSGWKDPIDPFATYHQQHQHIELLSDCQQKLELCQQNCLDGAELSQSATVGDSKREAEVDPILKLIIRNIISRLNVDINKVNYLDRMSQIYLSTQDLTTIRRYLSSPSDSHSLREQIRVILEGFIVQQDPYQEVSFIERFVNAFSPYLLLFNLVILIPALVTIISNRYSFRSLLFMFFLIAFMLSLFTALNRKYQENVAARIARSTIRNDEHCKPQGLLSETFKFLRGLVFIQEKSACLQYHEDLFVDPLYEISLLDVVSDVLSNFIFTPLGIFGRHFNVFMTEFYRDTPLPLVLVKTVVFIFVVIALLFWLCGYRLRTIFATIEPAGVSYSLQNLDQSPSSTHAAVENHQQKSLPEIPLADRNSTEIAMLSNNTWAPKPHTSLSSRSGRTKNRGRHQNNIDERRSHSVGRTNAL